MRILFFLGIFSLCLAALASPHASLVVFPSNETDWWVIGAENTLVFNWSGKAGEPTTTLYNVDKELMESPFFWESGFYVHPGTNTVKSRAGLVGAKPGHGYYIAVDVAGKHISSNTFEIKAAGSQLDTSGDGIAAAVVQPNSAVPGLSVSILLLGLSVLTTLL